VRIDVARAMDGLAKDHSLSPKEIWSALEKDPRWLDWQEGRISPRDWHLHVTKRLGNSLAFEQFTEAWNRAMDPEPILDNSLFKKLSENYRLALLSNTDPIHVAHMESTYNFFPYFRERIYSCSVGASKPNPLIYQQALKACKVTAHEAIYVDDIAAYAEAATRLGLTGVVFQSPDQLQSELAELGVAVR